MAPRLVLLLMLLTIGCARSPLCDQRVRESSAHKRFLGQCSEDDDMQEGLHHVEVYVSDLAQSTAFWGWLFPELGFEPYQAWNEGRSYKCGTAYVVFVQAEPAGSMRTEG